MNADSTREPTRNLLLRAANAIRDEWEPRADEGTAWHRTVVYHLAVADWLEDEAQWLESAPSVLIERGTSTPRALAVASAYLA